MGLTAELLYYSRDMIQKGPSGGKSEGRERQELPSFPIPSFVDVAHLVSGENPKRLQE
ncbi:uncharacterized protein ACLA_059720 [Aspergillus clavatus NRRL 1]|uniref:Uncharacterized protein n=1 Tax=Aspergillus clavatus (strain ATCC 1007 / CBS 513.65 / DSM 816 / NCTC 3887 / NRRL 1 / QM 1276 / 107) TaxID=344612 RepID=A1C4G5_ASPCL|nr:uncharacterized protein ACLA_059720 [Aspergillus clavatus NRRL 1]EAW15305.1 hypothetical protein ACLA_059720 [Aspergillus clavatus NRRL 1]